MAGGQLTGLDHHSISCGSDSMRMVLYMGPAFTQWQLLFPGYNRTYQRGGALASSTAFKSRAVYSTTIFSRLVIRLAITTGSIYGSRASDGVRRRLSYWLPLGRTSRGCKGRFDRLSQFLQSVLVVWFAAACRGTSCSISRLTICGLSVPSIGIEQQKHQPSAQTAFLLSHA